MPDVIPDTKKINEERIADIFAQMDAGLQEDKKIPALLAAAQKAAEEKAIALQEKYDQEDKAAEEKLILQQQEANKHLYEALHATFNYFQTRGQKSGLLSNTSADYIKRVDNFLQALGLFTLNYPVELNGCDKEIVDILKMNVQRHLVHTSKKISAGDYRKNLSAINSFLSMANVFDFVLILKMKKYFSDELNVIHLAKQINLTSAQSIASFSQALHELQASRVAIQTHYLDRVLANLDFQIADYDKQLLPRTLDQAKQREAWVNQREQVLLEKTKLHIQLLQINPLDDTLDLVLNTSNKHFTINEQAYLKQRIHLLRQLDHKSVAEKMNIVDKKCKDLHLALGISEEIRKVNTSVMLDNFINNLPCEDAIKTDLSQTLADHLKDHPQMRQQNDVKIAVIDMIAEYLASKKYDIGSKGVKRAYELCHEIIDAKESEIAKIIEQFLADGQTQLERSTSQHSGFFSSKSSTGESSLRGILMKNFGLYKNYLNANQPSNLQLVMKKLDSLKLQPSALASEQQPVRYTN